VTSLVTPSVTRRRRGRTLAIAFGALIALPIAGALYQSASFRREANRFPPQGRLVDVGGRRLHLLCIGSGEPTVIFEPGGFGGALSSEAVRLDISRVTRVCSYDRMGMGWSDPGPGVISFGALADDLEHLLDRGGLPGPSIFVPASMGGLTVELFARRHPDRVAGLVYADAAESAVLHYVAPRLTSTSILAVCLPKVAARVGLLRLMDPLGIRGQQPTEAAERTIAFLYRPQPMATICAVARGVPASVEDFNRAPPLPPDVPLTVLTAESIAGMIPPGFRFDTTGLADEWRAAQQRFARRSSRGVWRLVPGTDHILMARKPHVVVAAVLEMVGDERQKTADGRRK
jgi:pimeloyl-ACP methyl ester carboxylesterase